MEKKEIINKLLENGIIADKASIYGFENIENFEADTIIKTSKKFNIKVLTAEKMLWIAKFLLIEDLCKKYRITKVGKSVMVQWMKLEPEEIEKLMRLFTGGN